MLLIHHPHHNLMTEIRHFFVSFQKKFWCSKRICPGRLLFSVFLCNLRNVIKYVRCIIFTDVKISRAFKSSDDFHIFRSVYCEINYKLLSTPTDELFYVLCILILICSYMFRRNRHILGAYANVVKTRSNKIVLK